VFEQVLDINPNYARARRWVAAAPDDDHAHSSFPSAS
jgi:heat shock protein HspQ